MWLGESLPSLWLLTSSAASLPSVNEAGRVMAELDDWRTLMFVMLFIIVLLVAALLWALGKLSKAIEVIATLRETLKSLSQAAIEARSDAASNRNSLIDIRTVMARIEVDMGRIEQELRKWS